MAVNNEIIDDFSKYSSIALFDGRPFGLQTEMLMKQKKWGVLQFCILTELNETMFSRVKKENYMPTLRIFISLCIGLRLPMYAVNQLLRCKEVKISPRDKYYTEYFFVLENYKSRGIDGCNEVLKTLGVENKYLLGSHARKKH